MKVSINIVMAMCQQYISCKHRKICHASKENMVTFYQLKSSPITTYQFLPPSLTILTLSLKSIRKNGLNFRTSMHGNCSGVWTFFWTSTVWPSHKCLQSIQCLVSYLFFDLSKEWHLNPRCLLNIASIPFVQVINLRNLEWIRKACQPPLYFESQAIGRTSLNKAEYDSAFLIWTVCPVVKLPISQYLYFRSNDYHSLLKKLGITLRPDVNNVLQNLKNISQTKFLPFI